jgi:hypothetical protein
MGELDEKPFQNACKRKYGNDDYETKAAELVSSWQEEIKKPSWHPYKIITVDGEDKVFALLFYVLLFVSSLTLDPIVFFVSVNHCRIL